MTKKGLSEEEKENLKRELRECFQEGSIDRAKEILSTLSSGDPAMFIEILSMLNALSGGGGGEDTGGLSSRWDNGALLENILNDDPESVYARLSEACEVLALSDERFIRRSVNVPKTVDTLVRVIEVYSVSAPLASTVAVRCLINIIEAWHDASVHILSAGGVRTVSEMLRNSLSSFDIDLMETAISFLNKMSRDHPAEVRAGGALGLIIGIFEFFDLTRQELILATTLLATRGLTSAAEARECFGGPTFQAVVGMLDNDSPALRDTAVLLLLSLVKPLSGARADFTHTYYAPPLIMKLLSIVTDAAATEPGSGELAQKLSSSSSNALGGGDDDDDDAVINPTAAAAAAHDDMPTPVKAAELLAAIFAVAPDTYAKMLLGDSETGKAFMGMMLACLRNLARGGGGNSAARTELVRKMLDALSCLLPQLPASWKSSVPSLPGLFRRGASPSSRRHHSSAADGAGMGSADNGKGSDGISGKKKKRRKKEHDGNLGDSEDVTMENGGGDAGGAGEEKEASGQKPKEKRGFSLFSLFSRHPKKGTPPEDTNDKKSMASVPVSSTPDSAEKAKKKLKKKKARKEDDNDGDDDDDIVYEDMLVDAEATTAKSETPANGPLLEFGCNTMNALADLGIRALAPVKERVFMVLSQVVNGICAKDPSGFCKCAAFGADAVARVSCFVAEALGLGTLPCVCCSLRVAGFLLEALGRDGVTQAWRREGVIHQLRVIASAANNAGRKKARAYAAWLCETVGVIDKAAGVGAIPFPELVARAASPAFPEEQRAAAVAQLVRLAADEGSALSVYDAIESDFTQALALYFLGARCASDLRRPRVGAAAGDAIAQRLRAFYRDVVARENGARDFAALVRFANKVLTKCEALPMPTNTAEDIAATLRMARSLKILIKRDPEEESGLPEFPVTTPIGIDASAVGKTIQEYIWAKLKPGREDDDDGDNNDAGNNYKLMVKMNGTIIGQNQPFIDVLSASFHASKSNLCTTGLVNLSGDDADGSSSREYAELLTSVQNVTYRLPTPHELKVFNEEGEPAAFLSGNVSNGDDNNHNTAADQPLTARNGAAVVIPPGVDPLVHSLQHYTPIIELNSVMAFTLVLLHILQSISHYGIAYSDADDDDNDDNNRKDSENNNDDNEEEEEGEGENEEDKKKCDNNEKSDNNEKCNNNDKGNNNEKCYDNGNSKKTTKGTLALRKDQRCAVPVENGAFVNTFVAEKLSNCFKHIPSVVAGSFPRWCKAVPLLFGFLLPDDLRRLAFTCNYCGVSRSLIAVTERYPELPLSKELMRLTELTRSRFSVTRDPKKYIASAAKMVGPGRSLQQLFDVAFAGEAGTGLGPTTEFFALLGQEFTAADLRMWFQDAAPNADGHLTSAEGLFPLPYPEGQLDDERKRKRSGEEDKEGYVITKDVLGLFSLLGTFTAKSLLDNRILGVPFSRPFLKWMTGAPLERSDLAGISPTIGKTFDNLLEVASAAAADNGNDNGDKGEEEEDILESAMIPFELPGVPDYPLAEGIEGGRDGDVVVTSKNISAYAERVMDGFFGSGVRAQLCAFKAGFDRVLPMESLQVLSLAALEDLVCGSQDAAWDAQTILDSAKFEHGYSRTSRVVQLLAQVMEEFSEDDRKHFVRFLTGSPRLPAGGFAALNPRFTLSKKAADSPQEADKYLPSVNCCFHNIKFTEYSSKEILREKFLCAIYEGQGSFDFS